jgi:penicillin-binding protein 1C
VTLAEQAAAYRALARGGAYAPLVLTPGAEAPERRVIAAGAAAIVADMLADPAARTATFGDNSALDLPRVGVKTGTSKALRDNWCIGFSDRYVVGVWVGNHEGDAMGAGVSGVDGAAPAWAAIMRALHGAAAAAAEPPLPAGVVRAAVRFDPAIEPPRRELFLAGTDMSVVRVAPVGAGRPRLVDPVSGSVFALDPDIPPVRQRLAMRTADAPPGAWVAIDGRRIAGGWSPVPGRHVVELRGRDGAVLDRAVITVR